MYKKLKDKYQHIRNAIERLNFSFQKKEPLSLKMFHFFFMVRPRLLSFFKQFFMRRTGIDINNVIELQSNVLNTDYVFQYKKKFLVSLESDSDHLKRLKKNGFCELSEFLELNTVQFLDTARQQQMYNSHVPIQSTKYNLKLDKNINYYSLDPECFDLQKFYVNILINKEIRKVIDGYLGSLSRLYSINTMRSFPSTNKSFVTEMHRDVDDYHSLALFIYWTDTSRNDGATYYLTGSHREYINGANGQFLEGRAGSVFLMDTFGLHCGNKNLIKERTVTWMRFSQSQWNVASIADKNYLHFDYYNQLTSFS
jgi:hypothetical protein